MEPARWNEVKQLFTALLDQEPDADERLSTADPQVRAEVQSLLPFVNSSFFEKSAADYAVELIQQDDLPSVVGNYRLVRLLGRGGMGAVYLAERADGQFDMQAALKVLQGGVYGDDPRRRFLLERQLLASLNHANIVRLIDGGVLPDGRPYLIEDYVDGEPITGYARSRDLDHGACCRLLAQAAEAVAYAHAKGVVHRDLKPANILVDADGIPKLLDFGVASLWDAGQSGDAHTEFRYWTPAFAAPEQIQGLKASPAADVYSLGLILLELLSGQPPQRSASGGADLQRIPFPAREVLARCLSADPAARPAASELPAMLQGIDWTRPAPTLARRTLLAAPAVAAAGACTWWIYRRPAPIRFIELPSQNGLNGGPSVSPDGSAVAYRNQDRGITRIVIFHRPSEARRNLIVAGDHDTVLPTSPSWSPDGRRIAFRDTRLRGGFNLLVIPAAGGAPRLLAEHVDVDFAWTADSTGLFLVRKPEGHGRSVFRVLLSGRSETRITTPPPNIWGDLWLSASFDGRYVASVRYETPGDGDILLHNLNGGVPRRLTSFHSWVNGVAFSPTNDRILFAAVTNGRNRLWTVSTSGKEKPQLVEIPPELSPQNPGFSKSGLACFTSRHERLTVYRGQVQQGNVQDRRLLASPDDESEWPVFHPGGESIAWAGIHAGRRGIWISGRRGENAHQVGPTLSEPVRQLAWSPDGAHLAFAMTSDQRSRVWLLDVATGVLRQLYQTSATEDCPSWSADGRWFYFRSSTGNAAGRFHRMPWPQISLVEPFTPAALDGREAPGGNSFLYLANDGSQLIELPLSGGAPGPVKGMPPVRMGFWTVQGHSVIYLDDFRGHNAYIYRLEWSMRRSQHWASLPEWRPGLSPGIAASPDFKEVLWGYPQRLEKVYLVEGLASR